MKEHVHRWKWHRQQNSNVSNYIKTYYTTEGKHGAEIRNGGGPLALTAITAISVYAVIAKIMETRCAKVLWVGCGYGQELITITTYLKFIRKFIATDSFKVTAIDLSPIYTDTFINRYVAFCHVRI